MSLPCGVLLTEIAGQVNDPRDTADATWKKKLLAKLNEAYREVASSYSWQTLKRVVTLTDNSYIVPADILKIIKVIDGDKTPYNYIGGKSEYSKFNYNWYFDTPVATDLATGTTLVVGDYSTAVTSTVEFPATTCVNEYIRIGSNAGIYKISAWASTSALTLADYFRGIAESAAVFSIRPVGTPILAFSDAGATALTPSGVEITYIRMPLPLSRDEDIIELPGDCGAVRIKALQKILAMIKRDWEASRMEPEYIAALGRMKCLQPEVPMMRPNGMFQRRNMRSTTTRTNMSLLGY
jgi:hypothetical protein